LYSIDFLNNDFTPDTAPKFDSYLSVGDVSNHTITYNNNNYNSEIISYYDKINNDFSFDPSKLQVSFSMPFDWNTTRFQDRPIFVHEEIHIPKSFKEFTSTPTYVASVNGDPITGRRLIVDPYSLGDTVIAHILLNKIDIQTIAKTMPPGTNTMNFQLAPAAANVKTSSSVLTDFGGWGINLGWSPTDITANTQNNLKLTFFDAFTEKQVTGDVNYDLKMLDSDGNTALSVTGLQAKGGIDTQPINLPSNGIYRIEINIKSIVNNGLPDTSRIGIGRGDLVIPSTVTSDTGIQNTVNNTVVPEFGPVASLVLVIAIVSVVAVTAKTRLR
jgi:predicted secreted protein with PEFG-CTERM motif